MKVDRDCSPAGGIGTSGDSLKEAKGQPLPSGWTWTTLGEVSLPVEKVVPGEAPEKPFTYIDIASIDNASVSITQPKAYLGKDAPSRARQKIAAGDTLVSTVRTYLRNIALVPHEYDGQIASHRLLCTTSFNGYVSKIPVLCSANR